MIIYLSVDNAWVKIYNSVNSVIATPWYDDIAEVGNYGNSNWTNWSWTASTSGLYKLGFGVANTGDSELDSLALFDNVKCTSSPVPEPASMLMFGTGLIGLVGMGKRKFFS